MTSQQHIVNVEGLTHAYGERVALRGIGFAVSTGEIFGLLGPNGSGKTTLFRILSTLIIPTEGKVEILGVDIAQNPHAARRCIGVVFQSPSLDRKLTVAENLRHQGHLYGLHRGALHSRIQEMLELFRLTDRANDLVQNLSGGLRRRVELAKALLHRPELLLLDEPTTGLDPGARLDLWRYLEDLRQKNSVTILLTTHLMEDAERCDRLGILDRGKLVALGSPDELKAEIGGDVLAIETKEPEVLCEQIRLRFGAEPVVLDGMVMMERERGHEFITQLVEAFPGHIDAITVKKPSLEDVFIRRTGHRFWEGEKLTADFR